MNINIGSTCGALTAKFSWFYFNFFLNSFAFLLSLLSGPELWILLKLIIMTRKLNTCSVLTGSLLLWNCGNANLSIRVTTAAVVWPVWCLRGNLCLCRVMRTGWVGMTSLSLDFLGEAGQNQRQRASSCGAKFSLSKRAMEQRYVTRRYWFGSYVTTKTTTCKESRCQNAHLTHHDLKFCFKKSL